MANIDKVTKHKLEKFKKYPYATDYFYDDSGGNYYIKRVWNDGNTFYFNRSEQLHRTDGPAIEYNDGDKNYYVNDKKLSEEEFNAGVAGFNSNISRKKKKSIKKESKKKRETTNFSLKEMAVLAMNEIDLSTVPRTVTSWLGAHIQEINKIYTDKSKLITFLSQMRPEVSVSDDWLNNFIDRIKQLNSTQALKYVYNAYLAGSNLGVK